MTTTTDRTTYTVGVTTTHTTSDDRAMMFPNEARNVDTIRAWVEESSAGMLTAERRPGYTDWAIVRADGAPFVGPEALRYGTDRPITGYGCTIDFSTVRRMDRRWRNAMVDVRDAVRHVLVGFVAPDDPDRDRAFMALSSFEFRGRLPR